MVKLFFDVNVILDVPLQRISPQIESQKVLTLAESGVVAGFTSAVACATIHYLVARAIGSRQALLFIKDLLRVVTVVEVNRSILNRALELDGLDFEDNIQIACAEKVSADHIITRNPKDYRHSAISVLSPAQYLSMQ
ncbi:MAG: PIN domain-containing protein [Candidatus Omnitrophica bacterium]|nr:PIN domain-containing protein [Candidatus Omnitrophota bacterium]